MAEYQDREHFIPLRKNELVELLCAEKGLPREDQELFRQFSKLVTATFHFEYNQKLEALKEAYAPFDPDRDTRSLQKFTADERQQRLNAVLREFAWLLERANFIHLNRENIEQTLHGASDWGLYMYVDFSVFEHAAVFARGDIMQTRTRRRWQNFYRAEEIKVPVYQRLALILKLKPNKRLGKEVDTNSVYLKLFKDIPKLDVKMLMPTARVRFSLLDRSKVGMPMLTGIGLALWNILDDVIRGAASLAGKLLPFAANPSLYIWGIATGAAGYSYKSWYGYQQTKQRYHLDLTRSLYYLNLDSNAGVFHRLLDDAEEQECREALLAYFFLWRYAGDKGWTSAALDDYVELHLERYASLKVDFEIGDALEKLQRLQLVEKIGDLYRAKPIREALETLDYAWDNYFKYNKQAAV